MPAMLIRLGSNAFHKVWNQTIIRCRPFSNTYYDSQSGRHMTIPASQEVQLHDASLHNVKKIVDPKKEEDLLDYYKSKLSRSNNLTVYWNKFPSGHEELERIANKVFFPVESYEILVADNYEHLLDSFKAFEITCNEHLNENKADDINNVLDTIDVMQESENNTLRFRVNLPINVSSLLCDDSSKLDNVLNVVQSVAKLCDADVEVINLVLCTSQKNFKTDGVDSSRIEDTVDYVREILEECIGLDVPGAAVIDRLSIAGAPQEVVKMAESLGIKRFTVLSNEILPNSEYNWSFGVPPKTFYCIKPLNV